MNMVVDGIPIYYEIPCGFPSTSRNVLALFLHGAGGSSQHWYPLLGHMPDFVCPLFVDLPGLGRSGGFVLGSVDEAIAFLEHFLSQLHIVIPFVCVGHSLGGLIAQQFALLKPARIRQLVLIATAPRIQPHPDFLDAVLTGRWDLEKLRASFGATAPRDVQDLVLGELPKTRVMDANQGFMGLGDFNLSQMVSALSMPTLIIVGDDDVIISPRHSRLLHKKILDSTLLIVPGAGHYVQVEQPEIVGAALRQFIAREEWE